MFEINYEQTLKSVIPTASFYMFAHGKYCISFMIHNFDAKDNGYFHMSCKQPIIGIGDSEFSAWKNAYYNMLNLNIKLENNHD